MKYLECEILEKTAHILTLGDLHFGDKSFTKESRSKLMGYLKWVNETPGARIILMGDLLNVATRESKTSPFEQNSNEFQDIVELFKPYKDKIITAIIGNHESRLLNYADVNLTQLFCMQLEIPYGGFSCVVYFKVGKRTDNKSNRFLQTYYGYFYHGSGGGSSIGAKLNRTTKMREVVGDMDIYANGHSHQLGAVPVTEYRPSAQGKKLKKCRVWFINTGSYLDYEDSYAEEKGLAPGKIGSPRIRLDGNKHDIHISL